MNRTQILVSAGLIGLFLTETAMGAASQGRTANGCDYQIVNGKYFVNCPEVAKAPQISQVEASAAAAAGTPVGNDVPKVDPDRFQATASAPGQEFESKSLPKDPSSVKLLNGAPAGNDAVPATIARPKDERRKNSSDFMDSIYAGAAFGRSSFTGIEGMDNDAFGLGVELGANLNDYFGIAFGYTYQKIDLFLGLEQRSQGGVVTPFTQAQNQPNGTFSRVPKNNDDSALNAHMVYAETQLYFTESAASFRPFIGAGVAFKISTLEEDFPAGTTGASDAFVKQTAFGLTGSLGAKHQLTDNFTLGASLRLFIPIDNREPLWGNRPQRGFNQNPATPQNLFNNSDLELTESGIAQIQLMGQFLF